LRAGVRWGPVYALIWLALCKCCALEHSGN
jgi:hypothetical protein